MAKLAIKNTNVKSFKKVAKRPLLKLQRVFLLVGKPLYLMIVGLVVFWAVVTSKLASIKISFPKWPKKRPAKKVKITKPKVFIHLQPVIPKGYFGIKRIAVIFLSLLVVTLSVSFWYFILKDLPAPISLVSRNIEVSTKIYDRNGVLLYKIYKDHNRTPVKLAQIPNQVKLATLAAEDAEFYSHKGISFRGIFRSAIKDFQTGSLAGGSTITQQLVKNALLSSEKTYIRKIKEIVLAMEVENTFSKDQILEMYLNEVSYGGPNNGIEEASQVYFGKDVDKLSLSEAALLAGLPKSPSKYSPFANPDLAIQRQQEVLRLMKINKYITSEQEDSAKNQALSFAPNKIDIKAPHFVMYVKNQLADQYGEAMVQEGGLEVYTTLDYQIQKMAEETVKSEIESLGRFNVGNGAAVVINPKTGEILAMVGSRDYFDQKHDGNVNVTTRPRQPGSSIKIVNYSYALEHGYAPASIIDDSPITYSIPGSAPYSPKNYDGKFSGKISLRTALAESRNVPAVKVLASYGVQKMIDQGKKMGITTWNEPQRYGLSLTLGGAETSLLDLSKVYATIANYGKRPELRSITKVKDYTGKTIDKDLCINEIPQDKIDSNQPTKLTKVLVRPVSAIENSNHDEVAVKTGTSNDLKDNLTIGFNQSYLVATWVGNNNSAPMSRIASGITGAAPIWNRIMSSLVATKPSITWIPPTGLVETKLCGSNKTEWFLKENILSCPETIGEKSKENTNSKEGLIIEPAPHYP
ncbi:penicillin-binding protein [Candidatus Woesebacteria bacterium]|nr:penicillin-binding protein [Candidatus Woesebacteria bacterium]